MSKKYEAMVLSCMDPRFQKPVHKYLKEKKLTGKFSAFTTVSYTHLTLPTIYSV